MQQSVDSGILCPLMLPERNLDRWFSVICMMRVEVSS